MPADRRVTIRPDERTLAGLGVTFELVGDPTHAGGLGGWSEISRPRRTTALEWVGTPGRSQVLPLLLDGVEAAPGADVSVERQIGSVEAWGSPSGATSNQPPPLTVAGPVRTTGLWVLQSVEYGPCVRNDQGQRVQQYLTVTLLEYVAAQLLRSPAAKVRHGKGKPKTKPKGKGK